MKTPFYIFIACILMLAACGEAPPDRIPDAPGPDTAQADVPGPPPLPELNQIPKAYIEKVRPADGFDYPVNPPNARRYYKFRGFLPRDLEHLGEDWNGKGGGNSDFSDLVYAAAGGVVWQARDLGAGWGNVVRMLHNAGTETEPEWVETVYAHLASIWAKEGVRLKRGEPIGTIGDAGRIYKAHLHFEVRTQPGKAIGAGYAGDTAGFRDPTQYIEARRPKK